MDSRESSLLRRLERGCEIGRLMLGGGVGGVESIPQVAVSPKNRGSLVVQEDNKLGTSDIIFS